MDDENEYQSIFDDTSDDNLDEVLAAKGWLLALPGVPCTIIGLLLADDGFTFSLIGISFLLASFIVVMFGRYQRGTSVDLYTGGFAYKTPRASTAIPWEDIADVHIMIDERPFRIKHTFAIQTTTAGRLVLDSTFDRFDQLGESMMHGYTRLHGQIWDQRMLEPIRRNPRRSQERSVPMRMCGR